MIRPMSAPDKPAVMDLIRATDMFTPAEVAVAEELIDIYLATPGQKDYDVVVVEDDAGAVAGYMTWGPTPLAENVYDLYWMAVSPREQGRGRGKELVAWLEDRVPNARRPDDHHRNGRPAQVPSDAAVLPGAGVHGSRARPRFLQARRRPHHLHEGPHDFVRPLR